MEKLEKEQIHLGLVTVLVNVGGQVPLVLMGTINTLTTLEFLERHHDSPVVIPGPKEVEEEEEFLILDVSNAILPPGFPLTIAQLKTDVAINLDFVIMVLPAEVA